MRLFTLRSLFIFVSASVLLVGALLAVNFVWVHRHDGEVLREIEALVKQGDAEYEACQAYGAEPQPPVPPGPRPSGHSTKADALTALAWLERNPGWSPSYAAAADIFLGEALSLGRNIHPFKVISLRGRTIPGCELLNQFTHLGLLAADRQKFAFNAEERKKIQNVFEGYLLGEPRFRTLMEGFLKLSILRQFVAATPATDPRRAFLPKAKALEDASEARRRELTKKWETGRWDLFGYVSRGFEDRLVLELYTDYYPLARGMFTAE